MTTTMTNFKDEQIAEAAEKFPAATVSAVEETSPQPIETVSEIETDSETVDLTEPKQWIVPGYLGTIAELAEILRPMGITPWSDNRLPVGHADFRSINQWLDKGERMCQTVGWVRRYHDTGEVVYRIFDNAAPEDAMLVLEEAEKVRAANLEALKGVGRTGTTKSGRKFTAEGVSVQVGSAPHSALASPADRPTLWESGCTTDQVPPIDGVPVSFADSFDKSYIAGFQERDPADSGGWILNAGIARNSRALIRLAQWALSAVGCRVYIGPEAEQAPGYAVVADLSTDKASWVRIAGAAPLERVLDELWHCSKDFNFRNERWLSETRYWFGPAVAPCETWCAKEHPNGPGSDCYAMIGGFTSQAGDEVDVTIYRNRMFGVWDGDAYVGASVDHSDLTPAECAKLAQLLVKASDIAAGVPQECP